MERNQSIVDLIVDCCKAWKHLIFNTESFICKLSLTRGATIIWLRKNNTFRHIGAGGPLLSKSRTLHEQIYLTKCPYFPRMFLSPDILCVLEIWILNFLVLEMVSLHSKQTTALGKCTASTCKRPLPTVANTLEQIVHRTALRLLSPSGTNASLIAVMHEKLY